MTSGPELVIIAAVARNGVIGRDNGLPWKLRKDLQHFRALTMGSPVLMGRKTWESLGRPLPGRRNIVISRDPGCRPAGAERVGSLQAALELARDARTVFVIGGAQLYSHALPIAQRLALTEIDTEVDGDTCFPTWPRDSFREISREHHPADAENQHSFDFVEYLRVATA